MDKFENKDVEQNQSFKSYRVITNILMALAIIIYALVTVLLVYCLVDAFLEEGWAWVGFVLVLALASVGYVISLVIALIGLIMTFVKRRQWSVKGRLIAFIIFTILPIITEIAFIIVCNLI